ncbi:Predicted flavoprotein CzcO associated with the cation diffusion facilitator CzcD [Polaribacter sp. Hel1_33_78]|uniref:flavin-containing monooxygenase n=1 Tax=Polaribacter sp. Hel1_33_78 TaxID=1336804 RepID=UPI00087A9D92|nr:NAD(P)/FAD-dependent oxidoreductase [Polaribacter sp. Hel1_33_78]SDT93984.1 Predicted flavoprotein CzcO associated with the cation diffusion facilitator CzcD [Polaribacter sp. Hel1_33_78]
MKQDIIIIGAGLSGIGAACHLERKNKNKKYLILEAREELGGTWSLFKYPGIRSDSDMYTFGYSFKTWDDDKSFADAPSILRYLNQASEEFNVKDKIVYHQKVISYNFDTEDNLWTLKVINPTTQEESYYSSQFIFNASGYYNYDHGYTPEFKGLENFKGTFIHPQKWNTNLNYKDKKVVVIGSGATAVTIVPKIAEDVSKVTMLQRTPTYIAALPNKDKIAKFLKFILPSKIAHTLVRVKNILADMLFYNLCRKFPETMKKFILKGIKKELGNEFPLEPHFSPNYRPWDQRFCLVPDGDFFKAIKKGKADVITDSIDVFIENGILLKSGKIIEADIIISATGLKLLPFGGAKISLNNTPFDITKQFIYKGLMLSELPNFLVFAGYTNASWTLKSDLTSEYISRLLKYLDKNNYKSVYAKVIEKNLGELPLIDLDSGYIHRAKDILPKQGDQFPWRLYQNYILDFKALRIDSVKDKRLQFR